MKKPTLKIPATLALSGAAACAGTGTHAFTPNKIIGVTLAGSAVIVRNHLALME